MTMKFEDLPKELQDKLLAQEPKPPLFQFPNVKPSGFNTDSYKGFVFNEGGKHLTLTSLAINKGHLILLFRLYILGLVIKVELEFKG